MTISLLLLAGLMGVVVWWLFKQSINVQPWLAQGSIRDVHEQVLARPAAKTALWVFLAVVTSLFALFISAYAMRMHVGDWQPLPKPMLLWWNTAVLVVTSVVMQRTVVAARREDAGGLRIGLIAGGALTLAFLTGQLVAWRQLSDAGYFLTSNPANSFFYMLTAVHGLHVLGGLVAWGRTASRVWHGADVAGVRLSVELCAIYWHFLLVVWLVVFVLLLST
ncbi:MAG TPA: cytochrome c oxidase subunit 3 [Burkholderiaceae bacterium]|nr:cytochrome c oxidase subunit 3 [Burkholderiaceae bacterium]